MEETFHMFFGLVVVPMLATLIETALSGLAKVKATSELQKPHAHMSEWLVSEEDWAKLSPEVRNIIRKGELKQAALKAAERTP